jgi:hypothetical protein
MLRLLLLWPPPPPPKRLALTTPLALVLELRHPLPSPERQRGPLVGSHLADASKEPQKCLGHEWMLCERTTRKEYVLPTEASHDADTRGRVAWSNL